MRLRVFVGIGVAGGLLTAAVVAGVGDGPTRAGAAPTATIGQHATAFGISYGDALPFLSSGALNQTLDDAVTLGVTWLRGDMQWDDIQPNGPTDWQWANFDRVVAAANAKHLSVLPILDYTPGWAQPAGCGSDKCAPADDAQFASFAKAAVQRYAPLGVHTWEIWNEPNNSGFWHPAPNPTAYVALLKATSAAILSADPTATLISGGLAPEPSDGVNIAQRDFLTAFCALGGPQYVTDIGYHPYSFPVPPGYNADWNAWNQISNTSPSFQSILASYGYGAKKLWLTEYGAPTNGPGTAATQSNYFPAGNDHVDEALQAQMATDSVNLAASNPVVGALFWYTNQDSGTDPTNTENWYGLRRFDGSAKPAYSAFQTAMAQDQPPAVVAPPPPPPVPAETPPPRPGYWLGSSDGSVRSFGAAVSYGSMAGKQLNRPIVGMAATPDRRGYWLVASDGGIFTFGDAGFFGSTGAMRLNQPIIGMAATPDGRGYWLVASDGGIFTFGDAGFFGSTGNLRLNKPVVGMAADPATGGYWLVASDGGIFSFNAPFFGSTGNLRLNKPVVGMTALSDGSGYRFVASDGGVFDFHAAFCGSAGNVPLSAPVVGMATTSDGQGYWLATSNGDVLHYGDATDLGSAASGPPIEGISTSS